MDSYERKLSSSICSILIVLTYAAHKKWGFPIRFHESEAHSWQEMIGFLPELFFLLIFSWFFCFVCFLVLNKKMEYYKCPSCGVVQKDSPQNRVGPR